MSPLLSIVVPVFNEGESLRQLHAELIALAGAQRYTLEIIFVDDGSTDGSWGTIEALARRDARVRGAVPPQLRQGCGVERRV